MGPSVMPKVDPQWPSWPASCQTVEGHAVRAQMDGFRTIVFRDGDEVEMGKTQRTAHDPLLPRGAGLVRARFLCADVVDGELVIAGAGGLDFRRLAAAASIRGSHGYTAGRRGPGVVRWPSDLLALGEEDLAVRFRLRRRPSCWWAPWRQSAPIHLTPATTDGVAEQWFSRFEGAGLDGIAPPPPPPPPPPGPPMAQAARGHLSRRQAGDGEGQARAHRGLRRRRVQVAQTRGGGGGSSGRPCSPRPVRRRGTPQTRGDRVLLHGTAPAAGC